MTWYTYESREGSPSCTSNTIKTLSVHADDTQIKRGKKREKSCLKNFDSFCSIVFSCFNLYHGESWQQTGKEQNVLWFHGNGSTSIIIYPDLEWLKDTKVNRKSFFSFTCRLRKKDEEKDWCKENGHVNKALTRTQYNEYLSKSENRGRPYLISTERLWYNLYTNPKNILNILKN